MKRILTVLVASVFIFTTGCSQTSNDSSSTDDMAKIVFDKVVHDYGNVDYQGDGTCVFEFTNGGKEALVLSNVKATCGCTVPSWPKEPFAPGAKGTIAVKYDTKRPGNFSKTIIVYSNASNGVVNLTIKGMVGPAPVPAEEKTTE